MRGELLTPSDVRRLLDAYGLAPRRAAGQNFVVDPNTVRKIVRDAGVEPGDEVLEIGPGLGSLTLALAAVAGRVVAVEVDAGLVRALEEVVGGLGNVEVVHADALRTDLGTLVGPGAKLVANLPYNLATPLVMHAFWTAPVAEQFVMVQREVGERWGAGPGDPAYGAVSVKLALLAEVAVVADVPRTVFHPVPKVDSVTVRLRRRPDAPRRAASEPEAETTSPSYRAASEPEAETTSPSYRGAAARLVALIDAAFASRRKTLRNNLRRVVEEGELDAALDRVGIDPGARAEQLDADAFGRLDAALADAGLPGASP